METCKRRIRIRERESARKEAAREQKSIKKKSKKIVFQKKKGRKLCCWRRALLRWALTCSSWSASATKSWISLDRDCICWGRSYTTGWYAIRHQLRLYFIFHHRTVVCFNQMPNAKLPSKNLKFLDFYLVEKKIEIENNLI